jgi:hypothetical protein
MRCLLPLWFLLLPAAVSRAQDPALFDSRIKPILVERCVQCHGSGAVMSGFDLTTEAGLKKGGKQGAPIVPGKPDESRLYQFVSAGKMPPGRKLDAQQIEAIRGWIEAGAQWGTAESIRSNRPRAGLDWWSLQTPKRNDSPAIPGVTNPIDCFVLAKLKEKGLDFAPAADQRTLLRRLTFDLHGLPLKPEYAAESYDKAIDRLLAAPEYGERWGRHWLDVVRFGETDGGEHNNERFTAWKYRDYVIDAFNGDKPYNQFVREQIAGDVIAPNDPKLIAATGFLVAGPWDSVTKMINQDELMRRTIRQDELDDMVTTSFSTFQALTVNCARCHDHKFDPIPTRDYYRLTGVFNGAGFGERETATPQQKAARDEALAPLKREMEQIRRRLGTLEDETRTRLLAAKYKAAESAPRADRRHIPVNPVWNQERFAPVTAGHFRFVITGQVGKAAPTVDRLEVTPAGAVISNWKGSETATPEKPAYLSIDLEQPQTASVLEWSADRVSGSKEGSPRVFRFEYSEDGKSWKPAVSSLDHINGIEMDLPSVSEDELTAALPPGSLEERKRLVAARDALQKRIDAVPALDSVYAVKPESLTKTHLLERGSLARPTDELTPGSLTAVRQLPADFEAAPEGVRRLALADWIADTRNPLTARVIVNRIWYFHFGNGIVNTPSDFGFNGDRPSHPELLDYLANWFVDSGWSVKKLHRLILTSRTYQQSAAFNEKAHAIDAGNRLLWRMPLRRMDAETLRDSILAVSGKLNPERGGPGYFLQKKAGRGSYMHKAVDYDGPEVWKRAVYRFVVRGGERIFLDSFDCPDPAVATPQRSISNTPLQALTLMNNNFVLRQAGFLAERVRTEAGEDPRKQIERAYSILFQRHPSEKQAELGMAFVKGSSLTLFCRALLNSNEFVYVP